MRILLVSKRSKLEWCESNDRFAIDYKRTKSSLLFDGQDLGQSFGVSLDAIEQTLDKLVHESSTGVSSKIPTLFSQLVTALRPLTYRQLSDVFRKTRDPTAKYLSNSSL